MIEVNLFRIFNNEEGKFGNPLGIILDEEKILNQQNRLSISKQLKFSEIVFINDLQKGQISIFNPQEEVSFAGHALIGTSYFINKLTNKSSIFLYTKVAKVFSWIENDLTWIRGDLVSTPPWNYVKVNKPEDVEKLSIFNTSDFQHTFAWTWLDTQKNIIRAKTFALDWGIPEDEANGSGSLKLAYEINKPLTIIHGQGSVIYSKPYNSKSADVGGRVIQQKSVKI